MRVHLVNPSDASLAATAVITPRWWTCWRRRHRRSTACRTSSTRRSIRSIGSTAFAAGDIVGIGIHTGNALRGYGLGNTAREPGAAVVFGGIHATLYPEEARELGRAHAVVRGDGDLGGRARSTIARAAREPVYEGGQVGPEEFAGTLGLLPAIGPCGRRSRRCAAARSIVRSARCGRPTARGPASAPRMPSSKKSSNCAASGFRFIALADDNFYPVTLTDLAPGRGSRRTRTRLTELEALRAERFELMRAAWPSFPTDTVFFTQITMEAAEDTEFLDAMKAAHIKGALVGVEAVTPGRLERRLQGFQSVGRRI